MLYTFYFLNGNMNFSSFAAYVFHVHWRNGHMIQTRAHPQGQQSTGRTFTGYTAVRYRMISARYIRQEGTGKTTKTHRGLSWHALVVFLYFQKSFKKKSPPRPSKGLLTPIRTLKENKATLAETFWKLSVPIQYQFRTVWATPMWLP